MNEEILLRMKERGYRYDPDTSRFVHPNGHQISDELMKKYYAGGSSRTPAPGQPAMTPNFATPANPVNPAASTTVGEFLHRSTVHNGTVIRWLARDRFSYAAIFADGYWYITGRGDWYGTNKLTPTQLTEVLHRTENSHVEVLRFDAELDNLAPF